MHGETIVSKLHGSAKSEPFNHSFHPWVDGRFSDEFEDCLEPANGVDDIVVLMFHCF